MFKIKDNSKNILYLVIYIILIPINSKLLLPFKINPYISYTLLFLIGVFIFRETLINSLTIFRKNILKSILFLIGFYILDILLNGLCFYFLEPFMNNISVNDNNVSKALENLPIYITLPILGVLGPIVEEFIYRYLLVNRLSKKLNTFICVLISSFLFGLIHMHSINDLVNIFPYILTGFTFSLLYVKSNYNIFLPIILHVFNNTSSLLLTLTN